MKDVISKLEQSLSKENRHTHTQDFPASFPKAAVLVLMHEDKDGFSVVLTKRSNQVEHHKGQVCFPGGMQDEVDSDLWRTALRESFEEIGVEPSRISLIGRLSPLITPSGFQVFPFVGKLVGEAQWKINPEEIAEIFSVPLVHFCDEENLTYINSVYNADETHPDWPEALKSKFRSGFQNPHFRYQDHIIWGATGRILVELVEFVKSLQS